jgi:hypothetical protein
MAWGHPSAAVWEYTPRQAMAWASLGLARKRSELAEQLHIGALAARGEPQALKETLRELER